MICPNDQVIPQGDDRRLRCGHPGDEIRTPDTASGDRTQLAPPPSGVASALSWTAAGSCTNAPRSLVKRVLATEIEGKMAGGHRGSSREWTDSWTAACDASEVRPCGPWTSSRRLSVRRHPGDVPDRAGGELFDRRHRAHRSPGQGRKKARKKADKYCWSPAPSSTPGTCSATGTCPRSRRSSWPI